jgi:hypothetical protein
MSLGYYCQLHMPPQVGENIWQIQLCGLWFGGLCLTCNYDKTKFDTMACFQSKNTCCIIHTSLSLLCHQRCKWPVHEMASLSSTEFSQFAGLLSGEKDRRCVREAGGWAQEQQGLMGGRGLSPLWPLEVLLGSELVSTCILWIFACCDIL